ncbi:MAG: hypothetical protein F6K28_30635 [Microcoleus sp. SIO2G3]|nr:hypothetical protein [Microcoleus sp. SIO2G3]
MSSGDPPEVCPEGNQRQSPAEGNPPAALAPPCNFSPAALVSPPAWLALLLQRWLVLAVRFFINLRKSYLE